MILARTIASKAFCSTWQTAKGEEKENPWLSKHCMFIFHCKRLNGLSQRNWPHMVGIAGSGMTSCSSDTRQIRCFMLWK
jgi:hypothetical protein